MHNEDHPKPEPLTPGELASKYRVTTRTLQTWLEDHRHKIGERISKYFTVLQVKTIYECIGPPPYKD